MNKIIDCIEEMREARESYRKLYTSSMDPQTPEHGKWGGKLGQYSRTIFLESYDQMGLAYSISEEKKKYTVKIYKRA